MISFLASIYRRTGIHGAPPGTMLHALNTIVQKIVHPGRLKYASEEARHRAAFGGTPYYNITRLRRTRPVNGLALVFFMGAGDYLMATGFIRALHHAHPDLPIYAYASSSADNVNSPLVLQLLRTNPLIHRVFSYSGRPRGAWTEYDFSAALKDIPDDFVILPVIYDVDARIFHRHTALLETFSLNVTLPVPLPVIDRTQLSPVAAGMLKSIEARVTEVSPDCVVCTHFGARSSGYHYPHAARLISLLLGQNVLVVSFSSTGLGHQNILEIDVGKISPNDSIELLRNLKTSVPGLYMISVNSIMWPISAALSIPNLGLHVFWDGSIHQYLYPNIFVVTQHYYQTVSPCRLVLAPLGSYQERTSRNGATVFTDYKPEFVIDSFEVMRQSTGG